MDTTTQHSSRTAHLLALVKKGDDAFNSRDFAGSTSPRLPKWDGDLLIEEFALWDSARHALFRKIANLPHQYCA